MRRGILLVGMVLCLVGVSAWADDEVLVRSKEKPLSGIVKSESSRGVELTGTKGLIQAENILDIRYEVTPIDVRLNLYRAALQSEKDYYDPDPKKDAKRKTFLADAIKKYAETNTKVKEKFAKRHAQYKVAALTARQALDDGTDLDPAINLLSEFKTNHENSWQITSCLLLLGNLQTQAKHYKEAEQTYLDLAKADVVPQTQHEAELLAALVSAKAGKAQAALDKLQKLEATAAKDSVFHGRIKIAQAECLAAAKKESDALALLNQVAKNTNDNVLKALAYNTLGVCHFQAERLKEARWDFLWVDVVYNQDKEEHAKALYYLARIFDKLDEKDRAQECRQTLLGERAFRGMEWQRLAAKEAPKAGN
jgi:tetratricopeptide (TPR) repeat protein